MILSDRDIRAAIDAADIEIEPIPRADQYTTSAVDLFLGNDFLVWDRARLELPGLTPTLDLAEQEFQRTAAAFLIHATRENDGSIILHPYTHTATSYNAGTNPFEAQFPPCSQS